MRFSMMLLAILALPALAFATNYPGNGATGFGGPVGTGSLDITDSTAGMTVKLNRGAGSMNDDLVVYLDTQPGGFVDNSTFNDTADGGRTAISGFNSGNPSRTLVSFPSGFGADYAMSIENGFIGVFQLSATGAHTFLFGQGQSGNGADPAFSIAITPAQMSQIGLTASSSQTFGFVGSLISTSAYRSNETIGVSVTTPGDGAGNAGFSNPQVFSQTLNYTLTPEPTSLMLLTTGLLIVRRRRA